MFEDYDILSEEEKRIVKEYWSDINRYCVEKQAQEIIRTCEDVDTLDIRLNFLIENSKNNKSAVSRSPKSIHIDESSGSWENAVRITEETRAE